MDGQIYCLPSNYSVIYLLGIGFLVVLGVGCVLVDIIYFQFPHLCYFASHIRPNQAANSFVQTDTTVVDQVIPMRVYLHRYLGQSGICSLPCPLPAFHLALVTRTTAQNNETFMKNVALDLPSFSDLYGIFFAVSKSKVWFLLYVHTYTRYFFTKIFHQLAFAA